MDFELVTKAHYNNIDVAIKGTQKKWDDTKKYMETLQTKGGTGKFTEITKTDAMNIDYEDWPEWCEGHAEEVMGGAPESEAQEVFKKNMIQTLKMMKIGKSNMKEGQLIELNYDDEAAQFIFGYNAVCSNNKEKGEMHVLVSGFGKKWESAKGAKLDKAWWEDNMDNVKGYVKHGALKQARELLDPHLQAIRAAESAEKAAPGPIEALTLEGAGESIVNGRYKHDGLRNGKWKYMKETELPGNGPAYQQIYFNTANGGEWRIWVRGVKNAATLYIVRSSSDAIPTSGWQVDQGAGPGPTCKY